MWLPVIVVTIPAFLTLLGTLLTVVYNKTSKIKEATKREAADTLKLAMTDYVTQVKELWDACEERSDKQDEEIETLRRDREDLQDRVSDLEANVIGLKRRLKEL